MDFGHAIAQAAISNAVEVIMMMSQGYDNELMQLFYPPNLITKWKPFDSKLKHKWQFEYWKTAAMHFGGLDPGAAGTAISELGRETEFKEETVREIMLERWKAVFNHPDATGVDFRWLTKTNTEWQYLIEWLDLKWDENANRFIPDDDDVPTYENPPPPPYSPEAGPSERAWSAAKNAFADK